MYKGLTKEEAEHIETELIELYKSNDKRFGYNLQSGGSVNYTLSEDGRRHISESKMGKTSEAIKRSAKERGLRKGLMIAQIDLDGKFVRAWASAQEVQTQLGWSASTIRKCCNKSNKARRTTKGFIWMSYEDYMAWDGDISYWVSNKRDSRRKCVQQLSLTGDVVAIYESQSEASRRTGIPSQNISLCCKNNRLTAGGYKWKILS